jgi:hypothetical protein
MRQTADRVGMFKHLSDREVPSWAARAARAIGLGTLLACVLAASASAAAATPTVARLVGSLRSDLLAAQRANQRGAVLPTVRYRRIAGLAASVADRVPSDETRCRDALATARRLRHRTERRHALGADLGRALRGLRHCHAQVAAPTGRPGSGGHNGGGAPTTPTAPTAPSAPSGAGPSGGSAQAGDDGNAPPLSSYLFFNQQLKTVNFPDPTGETSSVTEGTLAAAEGLSATDPSRAPQSAESFYLKITYSQDNPRPELAVNASPSFTLPTGLTIDDSLPVRCAAILPPKTTLTEYQGGCSVAQSSNHYTILSNAGVSPAPAFAMTPHTKWAWFVPVHADRPVDANVSVSLWESDGGLTQTTTLPFDTVVGDPSNPIWKAYVSAPRVSDAGYGNVDSWGAPVHLAMPYQTDQWFWVGAPPADVTSDTSESFRSLVSSADTWVDDTAAHGLHVVNDPTIQHAFAYTGNYLGPAISDVANAPGRPGLQQFAGGEVWHNPVSGTAEVELTYQPPGSEYSLDAVHYQPYINLEGNFSWWPGEHDNDISGVQPGATIDALRVSVNPGVIPFADVCVGTPTWPVLVVPVGSEACMPSKRDFAGQDDNAGDAKPITGIEMHLAPRLFYAGAHINLIVPWKICYTVHRVIGGWQPESCGGVVGSAFGIDAIRIRVEPTSS